MSAETFDVDAHFEGWRKWKLHAECKLARWTKKDHGNHALNQHFIMFKLWKMQCHDIGKAAKKDWEWWQQKDSTGSKLPKSVFHHLIRSAFSHRNPETLTKFLEIPTRCILTNASSLYAKIKSSVDTDFTEDELLLLLEDLRGIKRDDITVGDSYAVLDTVKRKRTAKDKLKREKADDAYRSETQARKQNKGRKRRKRGPPKPAAAAPSVNVSASSGTGVVSSVAAPATGANSSTGSGASTSASGSASASTSGTGNGASSSTNSVVSMQTPSAAIPMSSAPGASFTAFTADASSSTNASKKPKKKRTAVQKSRKKKTKAQTKTQNLLIV